MAYENIILEVNEGIATITFNRPKALNALNDQLLDELSAALDEIEADEEIRVLVLTGAGEKSFVAGADITELATFNTLQGKLFSRKGQLIIGRLQELAIPVIAAVNGFALGGGSEIALACDFIYASENAMFGLPEITLGIIPRIRRHPAAAPPHRQQPGQGDDFYRQDYSGRRSREDRYGQPGFAPGIADGRNLKDCQGYCHQG